MANYWAIAIGINQYHLFQPLGCAQADAEALKDFLATESGFMPKRCLLMTDTSPPMGDRSTYPTKENILLLLEDLAAACWQPQDHVWLFFSGYGINYKGHDYLMPVEGNPDLVQETGIELRSLMQSLQLAKLNVLLILDINRAFGTQADAPVGQETMEIAHELQLATILSCQPEQFSHESSELGHGFFTAAFLAALRSGYGSSLTELASYLSQRTPELCQHHWRPTQNPVTVIPSPQPKIWPLSGNNSTPANSEVSPMIFSDESFAVVASPPLTENSPKTQKSAKWPENQGVETTVNPRSDHGLENSQTQQVQGKSSNRVSQPLFNQNQNFPHPPQILPPSQEVATGGRYIPTSSTSELSPSSLSQSKTPFWQQFLWWSGGSILVLGLITVVFLRNQTGFQGKEIFRASSNTATSDTKDLKTIPNTGAISPSITPTPPKTQKSTETSAISQSQRRNQAVLDLAKMSLQQTQASDLSLAIATARKITPGEPLYEQAQQNIQIWSQMILDLAESRGKHKQYAHAIAAAQLITKDLPLYPKAQAAINQWRLEAKQYLSNKTVIEAANGLIRPEQASTFNRAIEVAKKVSPGQPGFDTAQKSINKWSEKILEMAKTRAAKGELNTAIETAALVPEGTSAYEDAQEAVQKWQVRRIKN